MANLAEAVDATETDWIISADLDDDIDYLTVEDEIVKVTGNFPAQYQLGEGTTSAPRIRVERGAGGTTAASHADTTALTPLIPPAAAGAGGGAIPDPATGSPGDVPTVNAGQDAYELAAFEVELDRILAKDGDEVIRAQALTADDGTVVLTTNDAAGDAALSIRLDADGTFRLFTGPTGSPVPIIETVADGSLSIANRALPGASLVAIAANGDISLNNDGGQAIFRADGSVQIVSSITGAEIELDVTGDISISGATLNLLFTAVLANLPTNDPADGSLWADAGVVKVSTP